MAVKGAQITGVAMAKYTLWRTPLSWVVANPVILAPLYGEPGNPSPFSMAKPVILAPFHSTGDLYNAMKTQRDLVVKR